MGKKSQQSKGRNPRKQPRQPAGSTDPPSAAAAGGGGGDAGCSHYTRGSDELNRILSHVRSTDENAASCEHCRDEPARRGNKEKGGKDKGKQQKKKGGAKSEAGLMWVCLDCGRCFCGGAVKDTEPYGHARRHSKQDHHPWAVRFGDPLIYWCFTCNSLVPSEKVDGMVEEAKIKPSNVNDGGGGGGERKVNDYVVKETVKGHKIRGLANLGNTCFFNSVMQNLLAIGMLRDYLAGMDKPHGPLTEAFRKVFVETSDSVDFKGAFSPRGLFGCICTKAPQFKGQQQHDSQELLRILLDWLSTEEANYRKAASEKEKACSGVTFVDAIFGGQISSTVSCMECGHSSVVHEPFLDLSLPVPSKKVPPKKVPPPLPKKSKPPLRDRGRGQGRKSQEKGVGKGIPENEDHKLGNVSSEADCTEQCALASAPEQSGAVKAGEGSSWKNCYESNMILDDMNPVPPLCDVLKVNPNLEGDIWMDYPSPSLKTQIENLVPKVEKIENLVPKVEKIENLVPKVENDTLWLDFLSPSLKPQIQDSVPIVENDTSWLDFLSPSLKPQIQDSVPIVENDTPCLDFLGPSNIPRDTDWRSQDHKISVGQCSVTGQVSQNEISVQCASNSQVEGCFKELLVPSDSFVESSCRDEVPSSCIQDSGVILLPYKEVNPTAKEISGTQSCSQNTEILTSIDATVMQSSLNTTFVADSEQADVDFDGFGGLFNEPEDAFERKAEETTSLEMDTAMSGGNSIESTQEEVDNTDAPISVDRCLALFTKPELLSDEHAWYCERCSDNLLHQNMGHKEGKQHTARPNPSGALNTQVDGGEIGHKNALQEIEVERMGFTESKAGGNGQTTSSIKSGSHAVKDPSAEVDISQKSVNTVAESDCMRHTNEESGNEGSKFLDPIFSDLAPGTPILKDEGSPYISGHLVQEKAPSQDNQESGTCSINNLDSVQGGEQAPDHTVTSLSSSCKEDDFSEVSKVEKKGSQSLSKVHPSDASRGAEMKPKITMVKRDATKRILISKAPPILTVHLKRFGQDARGRISKLNGHVSFQEIFDLRPYLDPRCEDKEKCWYRLVGVVEHSGSISSGHYVAYVRSDKSKGKVQESPLWFHVSDAHVRESSLSAVLESEAYLLFYERV